MTFKFTITIQVGFIDKRRLLVYIKSCTLKYIDKTGMFILFAYYITFT